MKRIIVLCIVWLPMFVSAQVYDVLTYHTNNAIGKGILISTNIPTDVDGMSKIHIDGYDMGSNSTIGIDVAIYTKVGVGIISSNAASTGGLAPGIELYYGGKLNVFLNFPFYYPRFHITAFAEGLGEGADWYSGWTITDDGDPGPENPMVFVNYNNQFKDYVGIKGTLSADKIVSGAITSQGKILNYFSESNLSGNYASFGNNHFVQNAYLADNNTWKPYGLKNSYGHAVILQTQGLSGKAFNVLVDTTFSSLDSALSLKNLFTIETTGRTGIGSLNPKELLQVNGNITTVGNNKSYRFNTYSNSGNKFLASGYGAQLSLDSTGKFKYSNTSASGSADGAATMNDVFVIDKNGNVGIGTTTPQAKLAINGEVNAKKVRIFLTGWPDYVFEKDYKLLPLKEVEKFIEQNKHLAGLPSASEIEKNGNDVGETQAAMLKKIEELTLYIIELNKKIEKLENEKK